MNWINKIHSNDKYSNRYNIINSKSTTTSYLSLSNDRWQIKISFWENIARSFLQRWETTTTTSELGSRDGDRGP